MPTFDNFQLEALIALIGRINPTVTSIVKTVPELSNIHMDCLRKVPDFLGISSADGQFFNILLEDKL